MRNFTHLYKMDLPHRAIAVYIYLADRANKDGFCWPAIPTIARDLKLSESTTRRALHDLRKEGLVCSEQRYRENGGNSSLNFRVIYKIDSKGASKGPTKKMPSCPL